jgi:deaminated glutathione amidase
MLKAAAIQMCSSDNVDENLSIAQHLISRANSKGADLIVLPEMFAHIAMDKPAKMQVKEPFGSGKIQDFLARQAKHHQVWIVSGTIPISTDDDNKVCASCLMYDDQGNVIARYDKMHLFDVNISAEEVYRESDSIKPGDKPILVDTPFGKIGLAICYDIRFPELFRCLFQQGAEIFIVPAAFTVTTGQAHWKLLARARAVENFSYIIGACQGGTHNTGRKTFGHSLIVDPWGEIKASLSNEVGDITADIDLDYLRKIRKDIPIQAHQKIFFSDRAN